VISIQVYDLAADIVLVRIQATGGWRGTAVERLSDGRPAILAVTSPVTEARAEVAEHGTELEMRCWSRSPKLVAGGITALVSAALAAALETGEPGPPDASPAGCASANERREQLARLGISVSALLRIDEIYHPLIVIWGRPPQSRRGAGRAPAAVSPSYQPRLPLQWLSAGSGGSGGFAGGFGRAAADGC